MLATTVLTAAAHYHQAMPVARIPLPANVCGTVAGAVGVCTSWPQAWRLWVRRQHTGLSLSTNVMGLLNPVAWLLYGVLSHSTVQVLTSLVGMTGALAILAGHLRRARIGLRSWLPFFVTGLAVIGLALSGGRMVLGLLAAVATVVGIVPQLVVLAKRRANGSLDARGVSRARWLLSASGNSLWVVYGVIVHDQLIAVNSTIIGLLAMTIATLATTAAKPDDVNDVRPAALPQLADALA